MEENLTMADLMAEVDKSMTRIYRGQILPAKVALIGEQGVIVNIGYHADGLIPWQEVSYDEIDRTSIKEDDTFNVYVMKVDDGEGNVLVSKRRAEAESALEEIQALFEKKATFTVRVKEVVKGGLVAPIKGLRGFIPGSQLTNTYVADLAAYVGKDVEVEIIEFVPKSKKLVLSGKRLAAEKAGVEKAQRIATLVEGQKVSGTVTKLMPYGAFVDLGGVEGLVHNTDLSWVRIKHPSDVVKEGDKVDVIISSVDQAAGKIALSLKDMTTDPWLLAVSNFTVGDVVPVKVTRFASFGAFAALADGLEGLIHISQISEKRINKPEEALEIGQEVQAKIVTIDKEAKKIGLSLKELEAAKMDEEISEYMSSGDEKVTLGDVLGSEL